MEANVLEGRSSSYSHHFPKALSAAVGHARPLDWTRLIGHATPCLTVRLELGASKNSMLVVSSGCNQL